MQNWIEIYKSMSDEDQAKIQQIFGAYLIEAEIREQEKLKDRVNTDKQYRVVLTNKS